MAVDVSELINNGVKQAHTSLRSKLLDDLLEYLVAFLLQGLLLRVALMCTVLDIQGDCIENT